MGFNGTGYQVFFASLLIDISLAASITCAYIYIIVFINFNQI